MMTGAIQAANQAKKEQLIHVGQNHKIVMKSDRRRRQKEEEPWKPVIAWILIWHFPQTLHTVGEFTARESTQHKPGKDSVKWKEKKKFNTFFTIVSAITVQEAEEYKNGDMPKINKNKEEDREMKNSLMKKLHQSWMWCSK